MVRGCLVLMVAVMVVAVAGQAPECPRACILLYSPVCGTDGNTYSNSCGLETTRDCNNKPDLRIAYRGRCRRDFRDAQQEPQPQQQQQPQQEGQQEPRQPGQCEGGCNAYFDPVCGSDTKTYGNLCQLLEEKRCNNPDLILADPSVCQAAQHCPVMCPSAYEPVCGSDGETYESYCVLEEERRCENITTITLLSEGECPAGTLEGEQLGSCPGTCSLEYNPVCGGDGVTYNNLCMYEAQKRCVNPSLTFGGRGECGLYQTQQQLVKQQQFQLLIIQEQQQGQQGQVTTQVQVEQQGQQVVQGRQDQQQILQQQNFAQQQIQQQVLLHQLQQEEILRYQLLQQQFLQHQLQQQQLLQPVSLEQVQQLLQQLQVLQQQPQPDTQLMIQILHQLDIATNQCPGVCTMEYTPVCGSDGRTYGNLCHLEAERRCVNGLLTLVGVGECGVQPQGDCPGICTLEYNPVCGNDGKTYGNLCQFEAERRCVNPRLIVVSQGECQPQQFDCPGICTLEYNPVCGSDGRTYGNLCQFEAERRCVNPHLFIVSKGECQTQQGDCPGICTLQYSPVCGSDGRTYGNLCQFAAERRCVNPHLTLVNEGPCQDKQQECPGVCTEEYNPVCGSDGKTYGNLCLFLAQRRCVSKLLTLIGRGECQERECNEACTRELKPVCGSDGVTYNNLCLFEVQRCKNPQLVLVSRGACTSLPSTGRECDVVCTLQHDPVCGSDGVTYGNLCLLTAKRRCSNPDLSFVGRGECDSDDSGDDGGEYKGKQCPGECNLEYYPVCGTNGVTYGNMCQLKLTKRCKDPSVELAYRGECGIIPGKCPVMCPSRYAPVCGSDGKTYANICELARFACDGNKLGFQHQGRCGEQTSYVPDGKKKVLLYQAVKSRSSEQRGARRGNYKETV